MKKRLIALCVALMVLLFAMPASAAIQAINTEPLTLYEAPGNDSTRLMVVPEGSLLLVTSYSDIWARVVYGTAEQRAEGWVFLSLLRLVHSNQQTLGIVISNEVSLREEPSSLSRQLAVFANGTIFNILSEQGDWYYISSIDPETYTLYNGYIPKKNAIPNPVRLTLSQDSTPLLAYPEPDAPQIATLPRGTVLTVMAEYGDYYVVNYNQASGFLPVSMAH